MLDGLKVNAANKLYRLILTIDMEGEIDYIDTTVSRNFLMKASLLYQDICPEESRFLMQQHQSMKGTDDLIPVSKEELCPFCFEWRRPDNHHMRLRPKRHPSVRVQSVLRKEARAKRLSLAQRNIVRRFRGSRSAQFYNHQPT
ncbi:hypothetical protein UPYG_G00333170 [Umbra pygmaea]|uniref:Uncharacterized protein n=1 Tax=Umbra pygmaea TaxID=75934 RepID=A0ABD0VW86_UMBPY